MMCCRRVMAPTGTCPGAFHAPGDNFPAHDAIKKHVYDTGKALGDRHRIGEVLYNRGLINAVYTTEAIRNAMSIHNTKEVTPAMVRDGMESLDLTEARLIELGLPGFTIPVKVTCANHAGPRKVAIQRWDASVRRWSMVTDFYDTMNDIVDPLIEEDSSAYAAENNITPRDC